MESTNNIIEIKIDSYDDLVNHIKGKTDKCGDLRDNFIFRGLSNFEYELVPSALRKDDLNQPIVNDYVGGDLGFLVLISNEDVNSNFLEEQVHTDLGYGKLILFDKNHHPFFDNYREYLKNKNYLQIKRETYALLKFLNIADKNGLKINTSYETRSKIHNYLNPDTITFWPKKSFFEIISLAQHYNLPTCALDWTYDYHVALYFAVKDILENKNNDGVIWALNYRLFEDNYNESNEYKLRFYRPEYHSNQNLRAQKGLFTFLINPVDEILDCPLDQAICNEIKNIGKKNKKTVFDNGKDLILIPPEITENDIIFYKFVISKNAKLDILEELYKEGYSEDTLFPGYGRVIQNMGNRVMLENIKNESDKKPKKNILLKIKNCEDIFQRKINYLFGKFNFNSEIENIYIYSPESQEIKGYFKANEIIKNSPNLIWEKYHNKSNWLKKDFNNYFKDNEAYAIRINGLIEFKFPFKINNFSMRNQFMYIEPDNTDINFLLNFK